MSARENAPPLKTTGGKLAACRGGVKTNWISLWHSCKEVMVMTSYKTPA